MKFLSGFIYIFTLIVILSGSAKVCAEVDPLNGAVMSDSTFLEMVQKTCFDFFWNEANPSNGLIKDRDTPGSPSSIASVGFGLSAICIAVDHGWVSRQDAIDRVKTTLNTFWTKPQGRDASGYIGYKGFFYHFLDMNTAARAWNSELSSIDTGLLLAGILHAQEYFDGQADDEVLIRQLADSIYFRVDWEFMRNFSPNITLGWNPETGFINAWWRGYNEAMIMNILALGSPTHPSPASIWKAWTTGYDWQSFYGFEYVTFPPLFGHQYSHCWIDFRNIQDEYMRNKGITYFENSRRATLAQRAYCIANPGGFSGYGENIWGLTAGDGPNGYIARGAPPAQNDDGTISPTAVGGSIAFTPQESIASLRFMYDNYQAKIWKEYGFRDAFNIGEDWWASDVIGIDEGPIIMMIENYFNAGVWDDFMHNEYISAGLDKAGFTLTASIKDQEKIPHLFSLDQNYPNPFNGWTSIAFDIPVSTQARLVIYDISGREVITAFNEFVSPGKHTIRINTEDLTSGIYFYKLRARDSEFTRRMLLIK